MGRTKILLAYEQSASDKYLAYVKRLEKLISEGERTTLLAFDPPSTDRELYFFWRWKRLEECDLFVAACDYQSPTVHALLGYAHILRRQTLVLVNERRDREPEYVRLSNFLTSARRMPSTTWNAYIRFFRDTAASADSMRHIVNEIDEMREAQPTAPAQAAG